MRLINLGSCVRVDVAAYEVSAFADSWPGSGLDDHWPDCRVSFVFERRTGDLVEVFPDDIDGPDVVALSQDAQAYAERCGAFRQPAEVTP